MSWRQNIDRDLSLVNRSCNHVSDLAEDRAYSSAEDSAYWSA